MYHIQLMGAWILIYLGTVIARMPFSYPWYYVYGNAVAHKIHQVNMLLFPMARFVGTLISQLYRAMGNNSMFTWSIL